MSFPRSATQKDRGGERQGASRRFFHRPLNHPTRPSAIGLKPPAASAVPPTAESSERNGASHRCMVDGVVTVWDLMRKQTAEPAASAVPLTENRP